MPAGSKRTWDGAGGGAVESRDRKRTKDDPKDWRDVHLKSNSSKISPNSRRDGYDRDRRNRHDSERIRRSREHGKPRRDRDDSRDRRSEVSSPRASHSRHYTPKRDEEEKEEGE